MVIESSIILTPIKKLWFKSKTYGYGWYPATWQGWLVLGGYVLGLLGAYFFFLHGAITTPGDKHDIPRAVWEFLACDFTLTGALILVAYKTGEKAEWRWGSGSKNDSSKNNSDKK